MDAAVLEAALPVILGTAYAVRVHRLGARGQPVPRLRQASFAAGLLLIAIATCPPLDALSEDLVLAHMVQHTVLTDEAALLLAVGLTGPVLRPVLALPVLRWLRAMVYPAAAIVLWIVVMYGWHSPPLYQAADRSALLHIAEHASFLGAGLIMWLALLGPLPKPQWFGNAAKVIYTAVVHLSSMGLANILMWSGSVLYPSYAAGEAAHGISPLSDQGTAGAILMIQGGLIMLAVFFWVLARWAREDTERQELMDLADRLQIPLSEARAARAAAAGQAATLRRRLEDPGGT